MCKKLIYSISLIMLLIVASSVQAAPEPFSLLPTQDIHVCNDAQVGPDMTENQSGIHIRDITDRRRVGLITYDISEFKGEGKYFANVSFSNYGHDVGTVLVYGIIEELDDNLPDETTITWNTAPGVQNDPAPPVGDPVALDFNDLTDLLMTFETPARGVRQSTGTSQALADFLNSDTDGIVVFLFAPPEGQNDGIIRSKEYEPGGTFLQGDILSREELPSNPNPADEEIDMPRDVILGWKPGVYAETHDVYFGTVFDDVNEASRDNPLDVLVSQNQDANTYEPGLLEFSQTYYWRVDEVNAPPDSSVFKGPVWSFTTEPLAYPIEQITATASSSQEEGSGPENTINGSGLDDNDLHSIDSAAMWLSSISGPQPTWIQYEFDKVYKLHQMWVWNYNVLFEDIIGFGLKETAVEYSTNGADWQILGNFEFAQGPGADGYAHNTTVDFGGVVAKYVKITANSSWSGMAQYGLSEVRFFYIPVRARVPQPASGQAGVPLDVVLSWRAGREAALHEVYFSSDMDAVIDGMALVDTVTENSFDLGSVDPFGPAQGGLELGKTYYWKINEVNEAESPSLWEGDVWSFTATEYLTVDDFERYDDFCDRIFYAWVDGFGHSGDPDCGVEPYDGNGTGSTVGNFNAPFAEQTIVHEGRQSMPFGYDNSAAPYYSETQREWAVPQAWTRGGANTLTVWFYGGPDNSAESLYVAVQDSSGTIKVVVHDDPMALQVEDWQNWNIPLADFAGVDLSSVKTMYIGIGNRAAPSSGGTGKLYVDDIRLYP